MTEQHSYAYWKRKLGKRSSHTMTQSQFERKMKWENTKKGIGTVRKYARRGAGIAGRFVSGMAATPSRPRKRSNMFGW
jgi:hypothetical protein